jgi:hypothetical protein
MKFALEKAEYGMQAISAQLLILATVHYSYSLANLSILIFCEECSCHQAS